MSAEEWALMAFSPEEMWTGLNAMGENERTAYLGALITFCEEAKDKIENVDQMVDKLSYLLGVIVHGHGDKLFLLDPEWSACFELDATTVDGGFELTTKEVDHAHIEGDAR